LFCKFDLETSILAAKNQLPSIQQNNAFEPITELYVAIDLINACWTTARHTYWATL